MVLLHGLTATRRYVVMGSRSLERSGHRVIAYDARGHGRSSPAARPRAYAYEELGRDLEALLDRSGIDRAVLAGASMGAHTALWLALRAPERVAGLVVITPGYDPATHDDPRAAGALGRARGRARAGRRRRVSSPPMGTPDVPEAWQETVLSVIRQRLALHEHPGGGRGRAARGPAVAAFRRAGGARRDRSSPSWSSPARRGRPGAPGGSGEAYAAAIPGARLVTDEPGQSPVAWQGSQLSRVIAEVAAEAKFA